MRESDVFKEEEKRGRGNLLYLGYDLGQSLRLSPSLLHRSHILEGKNIKSRTIALPPANFDETLFCGWDGCVRNKKIVLALHYPCARRNRLQDRTKLTSA